MTFALALGFSATAALWLVLFTAWLDGLLLDVVVRCLGGVVENVSRAQAARELRGG
jgi:hypothetical protein